MDMTETKLAQEALRASEERFRAAQELSLDAFTILKAVRAPTGRIVDFEWEYVNSAAEQILHHPKEELVGRRLLEVLPGNRTDLFERYVHVVETGQPHDIEFAYSAEGIKGWFRNMAIKLGDGVALSFSDITRRKRADLGERLLARAGKILTSSLDYRVQLANITNLVVPHLADWCVVDLYDEAWTVHPIAMTHVDPAKVKLVNEMCRRYPFDWAELGEEAWLWQEGQAQLYPEITEARLKANAQDAEHYQLLRDLQLRSAMVVPLIGRERVLGIITFVWAESGNCYDEYDLALAEELAQRIALAVDNTFAYAAEQQARAQAEANQQRLALLAEMHERNRLGQELHDTVAQALGYLNLKLSMMNTLLANQQFDLIAADLQELKKVVSETYTDVREEIFNLRAKALSAMNFMELLERYMDKYRRFYNLDIQLVQEADPALFEFPPEITSQLIRTIQEALINIRKHSHVNTANIRLGCQEDGQLRIVIEDQGQGFDLAKIKEKRSSFGLQIIRERMESVGGNLEVDTAPGQGTRIILYYRPRSRPLNNPAD
jgi:PAS domain S-box-containing protein